MQACCAHLKHNLLGEPACALQVSRTKPADKGRYIKIVLALIGSTKPAVVYDCALTLTALSQVCSLR